MKLPDAYDLLDPTTIDDPYPWYASLREHAPVHRIPGTQVFTVSTRARILEVLDRPDDFSANLTGVLITGSSGEPNLFDLADFGTPIDALATADEPAHAKHRRLVIPHVTPGRIADFEPLLREWSAERIDPLVAEGGGEFMAQVADPIPTYASARLVGLPIEDADRLLAWSVSGAEILAGPTTRERLLEVNAETSEMGAYLAERLARAVVDGRDAPSQDVLHEVAAAVRAGALELADGVANLVILVSAAGESTSSLTGNATRLIAEDPILQAELRARPERIPALVEETLRLESSFRFHYRLVKRACRLGNVGLEPGDRLMLLWGAANRDPALFPDPDRVDLDRANLHDHLAFGRGIHFCVGARLARLEARVILEELLTRTRTFALDASRPPRIARTIQVRRHTTLPIVTEA